MKFAPMLTPEKMLEHGVFGGNYFTKAKESEDFIGFRPSIIQLARLNSKDKYDKEHNCYGVKAGETYENWMANGWIFPEDPLGWFHWYCRYASGRRCFRDDHQIARQVAYGSRWGSYARGQLLSRGYVSSVVKQGLLQWAFDPYILLGEVR
jgi:hypothetical protein